jgi:hypothetical protein
MAEEIGVACAQRFSTGAPQRAHIDDGGGRAIETRTTANAQATRPREFSVHPRDMDTIEPGSGSEAHHGRVFPG